MRFILWGLQRPAISIAVDRRPATGTAHKRGTLVVNSGGPDASRDGVLDAQSGAPALGAQYDLVSFDPRFFGLSTPLNCKWPIDLESVGQIATPDSTGLAHWAGWAAQRDVQFHLGNTTARVLHTVSVIFGAAQRQPLQVGSFEVTADLLPGILDPRHATGADKFYQGWSAEVDNLLDAANGMTVTPVEQLRSYLSSFTDPTVSATDHGSASTALECV